jgi:hypothetical protein
MSFKVVRNAQGIAVAFGPNDDNYEPMPPVGGSVAIEESIPTLPVHVPGKVTMRQAQEALLEDGTLDLVEATINAMTGVEGRRAKIQWSKSQDVHRHWPLVIQLGPVIGKTPEQMDALFIKAATL